MKFLCLSCDEVMRFTERRLPGDGTLTAVFGCPRCEREVAMLANPMETRFVSSMGVEIGGRTVPEQPLELVRSNLAEGRDDAFDDVDTAADAAAGATAIRARPTGTSAIGAEAAPGHAAAANAGAPPDATNPARRQAAIVWSAAALARLQNVPSFVRGMVKRIYMDYAGEHGITEITPDVMDRARAELGLEGM